MDLIAAIADLFPEGQPQLALGSDLSDVLKPKGIPAFMSVYTNATGQDQEWELVYVDKFGDDVSDRFVGFNVSERFSGKGDVLEYIKYYFEHDDDKLNESLYRLVTTHFESFFAAEDRRTMVEWGSDCVWFDQFRTQVSRSSESDRVIDFARARNGARSHDPNIFRTGQAGCVIVKFRTPETDDAI